jgi:hypothetical protein
LDLEGEKTEVEEGTRFRLTGGRENGVVGRNARRKSIHARYFIEFTFEGVLFRLRE